MKLISWCTLAGLFGFVLAIFTSHGCASSCAQNCPTNTAYIGDLDNTQLEVAFDVRGPACPPPSSVICDGDESSTTCTHTTVTSEAVGECDVLVVFEDGRKSQVIHLQFGPTENSKGTCCQGYPVLGPSTYVIPDQGSTAGVYGTYDGGQMLTSNITYVTDAAPSDGSTDAGASTDAHDAGTD